jgi:hypothetical protein
MDKEPVDTTGDKEVQDTTDSIAAAEEEQEEAQPEQRTHMLGAVQDFTALGVTTILDANVNIARKFKHAATFLWNPEVETQASGAQQGGDGFGGGGEVSAAADDPQEQDGDGDEDNTNTQRFSHDVILRIEITTSKEARTASYISFLLCTLSLATVIIQSLTKAYRDPDQYLFNQDDLFYGTAIVISVLLLLLFYALYMYTLRLVQTRRRGQYWSFRRKFMSGGVYVILVLQTCTAVLGLSNIVYLIVTGCDWFTRPVLAVGYAQWTLWNTMLLLYLIASHSLGFWSGKVKQQSLKKREEAVKEKSGNLSSIGDSDKKKSAVGGMRMATSGFNLDFHHSISLPEVVETRQQYDEDGKRKDVGDDGDDGDGDGDDLKSKEGSVGSSSSMYYDATIGGTAVDGKDVDNVSGGLVDTEVEAAVAVAGAAAAVHGEKKKQKKKIKKKGSSGSTSDVASKDSKPKPAAPFALVMDAPFSIHIFKLPLFIAFQILLTFLFLSITNNLSVLRMQIDTQRQAQNITNSDCPTDIEIQCGVSKTAQLLTIFLVLTVAAYLCAHFYFWWRTDHDLKKKPFAQTRTVRVLHSMSTFAISAVYAAFTASIILTFLVHITSCWTYIFVWSAVLPMMLAGTCSTLVLAYFTIPKNFDSAEQVMQVWLQEFAWTEPSLDSAILTRNARMPMSVTLQKEPMFCLETGIKMLYWSHMAYVLEEQRIINDSISSLEDALQTFNLTDYEVVKNARVDTKSIIAWGQPGNHTIVAAFKGTSSMENVITDLKWFPKTHPPTRSFQVGSGVATKYLKWVCQVHGGFWEAFTADDYDSTVIAKLEQVCAKVGVEPENAKIMFTGHSLGGALATLATQAWVSKYPAAGHVCETVTFGSPRVGNKPFAYEYNSVMANHWGLVNGKDPVAQVPKGFMYKRCGERIILQANTGDFIVRPTFMEKEVTISTSNVPSDHFLEQYRHAICNVIKSQFSSLALGGGYEGAVELAERVDLKQLLMHENMDLTALRDAGVKPISFESLKTMNHEQGDAIGCGCQSCFPNKGWLKGRAGKKGEEVESSLGEEESHRRTLMMVEEEV